MSQLTHSSDVIIILILMVLPLPTLSRTRTASALVRRLLQRGYEKLPPNTVQPISVDNGSPSSWNEPITVELGLYINYFYDINEQTMDYRLSFYLRQQWFDWRLKFNQSENENNERIKLDDDDIQRIWIPAVYFGNEKEAEFHEVTTPNRLTFLHSDGRVWFVTKVSTTLSCPMWLQHYPLDTQQCPLLLHSFGYSTDTVRYQWLPGSKAIEFDSTGRVLPEMTISNYSLRDCTYLDTTGDNSTASYPCLEVKFIVARNIGYFLIQFYIPSILLVAISWISFWISSEAVVARVSIGLLTVLNLVTQSTGSQKQLPKVSYVKSIDVWMTACLVFAFASLIEFAAVNVLSRTEARRGRQGGQAGTRRPSRPSGATVEVPSAPMFEKRAWASQAGVAGARRPSRPNSTSSEASWQISGVRVRARERGAAGARRPSRPGTTPETPVLISGARVRANVGWLEGGWKKVGGNEGGWTNGQLTEVWGLVRCKERGPGGVGRRGTHFCIAGVQLVAIGSPSAAGQASARLTVNQRRAKRVDELSRKVFPSAFILFNMIYWTAYCLLDYLPLQISLSVLSSLSFVVIVVLCCRRCHRCQCCHCCQCCHRCQFSHRCHLCHHRGDFNSIKVTEF